MDDRELYDIARAGHPDCIPGLVAMLTFAAQEILRLECRLAEQLQPQRADATLYTANRVR